MKRYCCVWLAPIRPVVTICLWVASGVPERCSERRRGRRGSGYRRMQQCQVHGPAIKIPAIWTAAGADENELLVGTGCDAVELPPSELAENAGRTRETAAVEFDKPALRRGRSSLLGGAHGEEAAVRHLDAVMKTLGTVGPSIHKTRPLNSAIGIKRRRQTARDRGPGRHTLPKYNNVARLARDHAFAEVVSSITPPPCSFPDLFEGLTSSGSARHRPPSARRRSPQPPGTSDPSDSLVPIWNALRAAAPLAPTAANSRGEPGRIVPLLGSTRHLLPCTTPGTDRPVSSSPPCRPPTIRSPDGSGTTK